MAVDNFYRSPGWQSTSEPYINRQLATGDIWPEGLASETDGGDKDVLKDGDHQFFAVGAKANRPLNEVGITVSHNATANLLQMNVAPGFIASAYVANVLTYDQGSAATFATSIAVGDPVFIDDSEDLDPGITLSLSPMNDDGDDNPLVGYIWYDQDDYLDESVGGARASANYPKTVGETLTNTLVTVMIK